MLKQETETDSSDTAVQLMELSRASGKLVLQLEGDKQRALKPAADSSVDCLSASDLGSLASMRR